MRMMLDHSVGVPVLRGEVEPGELYDWDRMVARLEAEEPFWEPGTRNGYHMINFGWTVGELVRRVVGPLARHVLPRGRRRAARHRLLDRPARGARAPRRAGHRRTPRQKGEPLAAFELAVVSRPARRCPALALAEHRRPDAEQPGGPRRRDRWRRRHHERPRPRRHVHAAGARRRRARRPRRRSTACGACPAATNRDATLLHRDPLRAWASWSAWTTAPGPTTDSVILGEHAFGHVGAGGSIGFADPVAAGWPSATR